MNIDVNKEKKGKVKADSDRYIKTSRREGVKNIFDAIVEILTNSGDSYYRIWRKNKSGTTPYGRILIEFNRSEKKPYLRVTDNAQGQDGNALENNFGNYRKRLSQKGDRSFMGKGAKDCTSLGSIEVESILDNKYNRITVNQNLNYTLDKTKSASSQIRKRLKLKKNGTVFTLHINEGESLPQVGSIQKSLPWHFGINKYIHESSEGSKVMFHSVNKDESFPLIYREPDSEIIFDDKISIESYPEAKAHLIIKKTKIPFEPSEKPFSKHGIIIQSDSGTGSYERTIFDESLREEPLIYNYFGYLKTDYISVLMEDFDEKTMNNKKLDPSNPFLILDENRMNGLNKSHPFTQKLFKIPAAKFKQIIADEKAKLRKEQNTIENNETNKLLKKLAKTFDDFIKDESDLDESTDKGDVDRFQKKGVIVVPPFLSMMKDEEKNIGFYIKENQLKKGDYKCELKASYGKESIEIVESLMNLEKSEKEEDTYFCKFRVKALSEFKNGILQFSNGGSLKTSIHFTIKEDLVRNFENDLEFERKNYTVKLNQRRKIRILAKTPEFIDKELEITFSNSDSSSVALIGNAKQTLKKIPKSNFYAADVIVEGRRLNSNASFTVEAMGISATCKVSVVEQEEAEGLKFKIEDEDYGSFRAIWNLKNKNLLQISARHKQLKQILGSPPDYPGQKTLLFHILLVEILADVMAWKKLQLSVRKEPHLYKNWQDQRDIELLSDDVKGRYNNFRNAALFLGLGHLGPLDVENTKLQ
jgi:hypothetical protein